MSRGQNPLVLMMALSLPGAAHALGLGEIHVNSSLNEPLAADIEILGATAEELSSLRASVANKDTFQRFGAERPAFLTSATFKVSQDVKGKPVLLIRSTDSFTEPVVNLLVDLRWHNGEVIRQYSLLLDPAGFPSATQVAAAVRAPLLPLEAPVVPVQAAASTAALPAAADAIASAETPASPSVNTTRTTSHVKIGAKATLRGVAWRVGARSDSDLKKTMLAIFRANPHAFEGNINRLRLGAVLTIPSAADISAISKEDAGREIKAQMTAWRASPQKARSAVASAQATAAPAAATASEERQAAVDAPRSTTPGTDSAEAAALNLRVQSLEQGLHDVQGQLKHEHDKLLSVQAQVIYAENAANAPVDAAPVPHRWLPPALIGGLALLAAALGAMLFRRRPAKMKLSASPAVAAFAAEQMPKSAARAAVKEPAPRESVRETPRETPREALRDMPRPVWQELNDLSASRDPRDDRQTDVREAISAGEPEFTVNEDDLRASYEDTLDLSSETAILAADIAAASGDTANLPAATVNLNARSLQGNAHELPGSDADESPTVDISAAALHVDATKLDYNLLDLDQTALHVHMPSELHERSVVKERRTNLVDVLKMAVEREPDRRDLRMKLLETYYAAAAANRKGFLELVQKLAHDRDRLGEGEWDKIAYMGKQIAADSDLFDAELDASGDNELADCA
jgi:pilus assembly protein FimV